MLMSNKISIMVKRLKLATRGFGAEPGRPDVEKLAPWIATHRGHMADITTYLMEESLAPQVSAVIQIPCAGGKFYAGRVRDCLRGLRGNRIMEELSLDTAPVIEDAAGIVVQKKGAWCALPAPQALGLTDNYYQDADEHADAINSVYCELMRSMRDTGVAGHVLIVESMHELEVQALARKNVFFFQPSPTRKDLAILLERQRQVAVTREMLPTLFELRGEYDFSRIFLMDPDRGSVHLALSHLDPDQISAGGYCTQDCGEYWKWLVASAVYER
jgi:hypothetical protein